MRRNIDLTEEQWRLVKSHAAKRGQTISAFFSDLLAEVGLDGHVRPSVTMGNIEQRPKVDLDPLHGKGKK